MGHLISADGLEITLSIPPADTAGAFLCAALISHLEGHPVDYEVVVSGKILYRKHGQEISMLTIPTEGP